MKFLKCALILIFALVIIPILNGCSSDSEKSNETTVAITSEEKYVDDEVVNTFISKYNAISSSPFDSIENGHTSTKYYSSSYGYRYTLLHAANTDKIDVTIEAKDDSGIVGMMEGFRDATKAITNEFGDDRLNEFFSDGLDTDNYVTLDLGEKIQVIFNPEGQGYSSGKAGGFIRISEK